ncbi:MAG: 1-acyl-sn-glycerol-3-phosphate acyltransferase [Myxococcales bacterium]
MPARPAAEQPVAAGPVLVGEIVDEAPKRDSLLAPAPGAFQPPPASKREPGRLESLRRSAVAAFEGAMQGIVANLGPDGVGARLSSLPGADQFAQLAKGLASTAAPAVDTARALLPPAVGAARTVASSLASGQAFGDVARTVAEAADAVQEVNRRKPPTGAQLDHYGEDPSLLFRLEPVLDFLHDRWFRVEVAGSSRVPAGACLVVCNHAGALPVDGPMMRTVLRRACGRADARWLVSESLAQAPLLGGWLRRLGAVRASNGNSERLLAEQKAVIVFPEGELGSTKTVAERYRLRPFGRGEFVKLAMRSGVPIVPAAIIGNEDSSPLIGRIPLRALGRALPVTPTFPWLGPLGLLPLPTKWRVSFLEPLDLSGHGPKAADDVSLVLRLTEQVRRAVQEEIDRLLRERA